MLRISRLSVAASHRPVPSWLAEQPCLECSTLNGHSAAVRAMTGERLGGLTEILLLIR